VLFRVHKVRSFDPFPMNGRAMNQSRRHRSCTHALPHFREFWILFRLETWNA
jgi:hypothetical protein